MSSIEHPESPRRKFLVKIAAAAAAVGFSGSMAGRASAAESVASDPALDAWFARIKGMHRQVFDTPEPNSGMAAIWPRIYMNTMNATYGEAQGTSAVVILRHAGIGLGLNDAIWSKYKIGEMIDVKDGDAFATKNPYATITGLPIPGLGIAELLKSGVMVGACDVALTVYSSGAAQKMGMNADAVKKEWIAGLLPGIQVVPSGVMAVGRAQELKCTYCFAG
jgi:hypothetical protein